ncbi:hypothetical protein MAM1_0019c01728 [Mucor ambiguus]|uniref:phosphoglycerate kinase n=1 Tax=Mucor ambiguus TaxID=91626 RepID=A0A0C9LRT6_9FUNG|nr:hypothetical protein MAM1_0019c01728 [Mucor ambiguus]
MQECQQKISSKSLPADKFLRQRCTEHHAWLSHASIAGVNLPYKAAGLLLKKELEMCAKLLVQNHCNNDNPFLAILGGAKLSPKHKLVLYLPSKVYTMIICGALAWPFVNMGDDMD